MWTKFNKTLGAAITGVLGWATFVVNSPSAPITAPEWLLLGGVAVTVLTVFGVPNLGNGTTIQLPPALSLPESPFVDVALNPAPPAGIPSAILPVTVTGPPGAIAAIATTNVPPPTTVTGPTGVGGPETMGGQSPDVNDVANEDGTPK